MLHFSTFQPCSWRGNWEGNEKVKNKIRRGEKKKKKKKRRQSKAAQIPSIESAYPMTGERKSCVFSNAILPQNKKSKRGNEGVGKILKIFYSFSSSPLLTFHKECYNSKQTNKKWHENILDMFACLYRFSFLFCVESMEFIWREIVKCWVWVVWEKDKLRNYVFKTELFNEHEQKKWLSTVTCEYFVDKTKF